MQLAARSVMGFWALTGMDLGVSEGNPQSVKIFSSASSSSTVLLKRQGFLNPLTLYSYDTQTGAKKDIRSGPVQFNAEGLETKQLWATSADGTKVPYWLTGRKGAKLDGSTPTVIWAYGGCHDIDNVPEYRAGIILFFLRLFLSQFNL
jgi:prolyl oligopeptidase